MWDPDTYSRYGDERARPFGDLVARVGADSPGAVVDLGCGPGNLTVALAARWPNARVRGLDSSPEMIEKARSLGSTVDFSVGDVRDWEPDPATQVVISNATMHWVAEHPALLVRWAGRLRPGSWLAVQVPGNFDAPSHRVLRDVAGQRRWRERLEPFVTEPRTVLEPSGYAAMLLAAGCDVDAWETTYLHVLRDEPRQGAASHPVLRWMEGTALRPVRVALAERADWTRFRDELGNRLADAYPVRDGTVYFPFRRVFCVARVGARPAAAG